MYSFGKTQGGKERVGHRKKKRERMGEKERVGSISRKLCVGEGVLVEEMVGFAERGLWKRGRIWIV